MERISKQSPEQPSILEAAQKYVKQGYSIVPIKKGEKRPLIQWEIYQNELPSDKELDRWFKDTTNQIGIVTGCVSGGLFILDFDGKNWQESFKEFLEKFTEFVDSLVVQTGSGKSHIYGICPDMPKDLTRRIKKYFDAEGKTLGEVELRGNNHQSLCPPSFHPSGGQYSSVDDTYFPNQSAWKD